jgi:Membrane magnesium transporter
MVSFSTCMFAFGAIILLHSAYSCVHYRHLLQAYDEAISGMSTDVLETSAMGTTTMMMKVPPHDVIMESLIGFLLIFGAELIRPGSNLRPAVVVMTTTSTKTTTTTTMSSNQRKQQPFVAPVYITRDFDIYHTRARGLYQPQKQQ